MAYRKAQLAGMYAPAFGPEHTIAVRRERMHMLRHLLHRSTLFLTGPHAHFAAARYASAWLLTQL